MVFGVVDGGGACPSATRLAPPRHHRHLGSQRPLTDSQLSYAIADVSHLRVAYEKLRARIEVSVSQSPVVY